MDDFPLGAHTYRTAKMPPLPSFHVARRVIPVLAQMGLTAAQLENGANAKDAQMTMMQLLGPVAEVVAKMSDDDVNYVIYTCLAHVSRKQSDGRYAPVVKGLQMMFADLTMDDMLGLTIQVLRENVGSFFPQLPGGSGSP